MESCQCGRPLLCQPCRCSSLQPVSAFCQPLLAADLAIRVSDVILLGKRQAVGGTMLKIGVMRLWTQRTVRRKAVLQRGCSWMGARWT